MFKAIKIALLYWLQQALRAFCPHLTRDSEALRGNAHVCPNCALAQWVSRAINNLCGWRAYSQLRKCDLCHEPLSKRETGVHLACAERENALADYQSA